MQPLDIKKIKATITNKYHEYLQQDHIVIFDELPSTNSYLLECAKNKNNKIIFCLAEKQSAGRGRSNRTWFSPIGNIYLSILWLFNNQNINQLSGLSLAIAVAVDRALNKYGINNIALKWPNDILYQDRKLAGILIETIPQKINNTYVVIGLGMNIDISSTTKSHSLINNLSAIDIASIIKKPPDRNLLIGLLINSILDTIFLFQDHGLKPFIKEWQTKDYSYGKFATITMGEKNISGISRGINKQGHLLLDVISNNDNTTTLHTIVSGEVSLLITS